MTKLIDLTTYPVKPVLNTLLQDKTTKENIIFATDNYSPFGSAYSETSPMEAELLVANGVSLIQPRVTKEAEAQIQRQRIKAEVFTPSWIVNKMNNHCDEEWFGRPNVFNIEDGTSWVVVEESVFFPEGKTWKEYIDSRRIEITCGEAPYIVSRYDATTGDLIPLQKRIGILDRKLRILNENAADDEEWNKWVVRAFQSVYGYEFQGDNLLIARINLVNTYVDYYSARYGNEPEVADVRKIANIISWNLWQMDGITGTIPFGTPEKENEQFSMFDFANEITEERSKETPACKIYDWRGDDVITYNNMKRGAET